MPATERPSNVTIIVGQLGTTTEYRRSGGRTVTAPAVCARRPTALGGATYEFAVQLETSAGAAYSMKLQLNEATPGFERIARGQEGDRIVVEGVVQTVATVDRRFAGAEGEDGLTTRDLQVQVLSVREPREDEPQQATAVWLDGTVVEPARVISHPDIRSLQMATTVLQVYVDRSSPARPGYPGLRREHRDLVEVPVGVSLAHPMAGLLLRPGNNLRIDGELLRMEMRQGGRAVEAALASLEAEWQARQPSLAALPEAEQRRAAWAHRRQVQRISTPLRTLVLASYIAAGDEKAQPLTLSEARHLRRVFIANLRKGSGTSMAREQSRVRADA